MTYCAIVIMVLRDGAMFAIVFSVTSLYIAQSACYVYYLFLLSLVVTLRSYTRSYLNYCRGLVLGLHLGSRNMVAAENTV